MAGDISCSVGNTESVNHVLNTFKEFKHCAGLNVNMDKTKAIYLGNMTASNDNLVGFNWLEWVFSWSNYNWDSRRSLQ